MRWKQCLALFKTLIEIHSLCFCVYVIHHHALALGNSTKSKSKSTQPRSLTITTTLYHPFSHLTPSCTGASQVGKSKSLLFPSDWLLRRIVASGKRVSKAFPTCPNPASSFPNAVILYVTICRFTVWPAPLVMNCCKFCQHGPTSIKTLPRSPGVIEGSKPRSAGPLSGTVIWHFESSRVRWPQDGVTISGTVISKLQYHW